MDRKKPGFTHLLLVGVIEVASLLACCPVLLAEVQDW